MPETTRRLDEIKERCEQAAPGPWRVEAHDGDNAPPWILCDALRFAMAELVADAPTHDFLAHAREDIPYLLAALTDAVQRIQEKQRTIDLINAELGRMGQRLDDAHAEIARLKGQG